MKKDKKKKNVESVEEELIKEEIIEEAEETDEVVEEEIVTLSREEYEALQKELADAREDAVENLNAKLRAIADNANYRKQLDREKSQMRMSITGEVTKKYLPVLDDINLALKNRPVDVEVEAWSAGIELVAKKLNTILEQQGIEPVAKENEAFDPTCHEAISSEESPDHDSEVIIEVMQQGYRLPDGRVLRPALVRVAR